ncbi:monosaccharide ABC transporter substrate-binding protein (CUT2 family) [Propionicimonas paludicola]|uniref:Monosaccharide ABC transporter substrate-binding protein (CUT2 family) n=1 Tax=Propionicimonas paludicola TaxID=185243 RepID=A0A2A9CQJ1_9ACTN|nr:multiple monosaccharide ABC transporter substrate-binding protein [Propionicimonas paludicola]PFG15882.1 monosaccharide ABC transporter substrate-binding protein (CUT2 family) [Propionicimonas paludicola]
MSHKSRIIALAAAGAMVLSMGACSAAGGTGGAATGCNVGITMPTRSLERWINDGEQLKKQLEEAKCTVDLQYADDKVDQQISQIQNQIAGGAKILVIASIDGTALGPVLDTAAKQKIKVIAYDRLINGSPNVDYYATFDNYKVGQLQGNFLKDQLKLDSASAPINFEPFAGSPDDNNAKFFFSGAWDVLLPYVTKGTLVVPSGKAPKSNDEWTKIGIQGWKSANAQSEMDNRLSSFYAGGKKVQAVLSPNDSLAIGIEASLKSAGYKVGTDWPIITGQDGDKANVKAILAGEQSMTVWKDTRKLGAQVFKMIQQITKGEKVDVNDEKTYNNGVKVVPSYLIEPEVVTKDQVQSKLIDSGFLKAADVGL